MLEIKKVENGFILDQTIDTTLPKTSIYYTPDDSLKESLVGLRSLFYKIMDLTGFIGCKHDALRLQLLVVDQEQFNTNQDISDIEEKR